MREPCRKLRGINRTPAIARAVETFVEEAEPIFDVGLIGWHIRLVYDETETLIVLSPPFEQQQKVCPLLDAVLRNECRRGDVSLLALPYPSVPRLRACP